MCTWFSNGHINVLKMEATAGRLVNVGYHKVTIIHVLSYDHNNKDDGQTCDS
jgi:hypothetical protein